LEWGSDSIVLWKALGRLEPRPQGRIDPFGVDWFVAPGLFQGMLAGHLLHLAVKEGNGAKTEPLTYFALRRMQ